MKLFKDNIYIIFFILIVGVFFAPFLIQGKLPVPADALVGMYHPWRDALEQNYPNGYPFKNPLITDPVRQQIPYRKLAVEILKSGQLPKWNPYSFSGVPLFANSQSAVFYPLNFLFWIFDFPTGWSILILLQPLLAGLFIFIYLKSLNLDEKACFLGSISFAFSGFMIAWLEWNTIGQVALWLPLILFCVDKLFIKWSWKWLGIFFFAVICTVLAGHLQTNGYLGGFLLLYILARFWQKRAVLKYLFKCKKGIKEIVILLAITVGLVLVAFQLNSTFRLINLSARNFDLPDWHRPDWFIPWQNFLQFIAPDFFGNPATGNYWGIWNYGEFVGYIGLIPLIFAIFALIYRRDKKILFFGSILFISLFLAFPTWLGKLPYILRLPYISTMQPSRILIIVDFCLAVLAALGVDHLLSTEKKFTDRFNQIIITTGAFVLSFVLIWTVVLLPKQLGLSRELITNLAIAKRNLYFPTLILSIFIGYLIFIKINGKWKKWVNLVLLMVVSFDLLRFGMKFTPFTNKELFFPSTKSIEFLQNNLGYYRLLTTDRQILPPNTSGYYKLNSIDGYDPLYLSSYAKLVSAWTRNKPDISPAAFNRILTPETPTSFFADLLGVKYVLSFKEENDPKLTLVFQEGKTRVYENKKVYPRAFMVEEIVNLSDEQTVIEAMFKNQNQLNKKAFTNINLYVKPAPLFPDEKADILSISENKLVIKTFAMVPRLLVVSDLYYPDWQVHIDGKESTIFLVDLSLKGIILPEGEHRVELKI